MRSYSQKIEKKEKPAKKAKEKTGPGPRESRKDGCPSKTFEPENQENREIQETKKNNNKTKTSPILNHLKTRIQQ